MVNGHDGVFVVTLASPDGKPGVALVIAKHGLEDDAIEVRPIVPAILALDESSTQLSMA